MCQLTLVNSTNYELNKLILFNQLLLNSKVYHRDGTGFFQRDGLVFKTKLAAGMIDNLPELVNAYIKTKSPIIAHVRQASFKQTTEDKNAHPFETDKLVLAHNGTLLPVKEVFDKPEYKDMIDTEIFIKELDLRYDGKNMVKALNETMKLFIGPFAFLIFSKLENRYYVVRGKTKLLHIAHLKIGDKEAGYVINTDRDDLDKSLNAVKAITNVYADLKFEAEPAVLLAENSIFKVEKNVVAKVGDITENEPPKAAAIVTNTVKHTIMNAVTDVQKIVRFMLETCLTLTDIDRMMYSVFEVGLLYINDTDLNSFVTICLPTLENLFSEHKLALWKKIQKETGKSQHELYENYDIQFPYFVNKNKTLRHLYNDLMDEKRKSTK